MTTFPKRILVPLAALLLGVGLAACGGGGSTLTVNSDNDADDGVCDLSHCSLREAILKANALAGTTTIQFNIGGGGLQTIHPASALPAITKPVRIDGTTQPGYSFDPLIVIDGSETMGTDGLLLSGGSSSLKRLVINNFHGWAVVLSGSGENRVLGCYIGTDPTGSIRQENLGGGIRIQEGEKNVIGGAAAGERNLISGNHGDGIRIQDIRNSVIGNYIGVDVTGTHALKNIGAGIMNEAGLTIIGGAGAGEGNLISGNESTGISFQTHATDGFVLGNRIGTDAAGAAAIGNSWGITLHGGHNTIGGDTAAKRNVISGNQKDGIFINAPSENNIIQGNFIGVTAAGDAALGNQESGIQVAGNSNDIGEIRGTTGNVISGNTLDGVTVDGTGNMVQGNLIGVNAAGTAALGNGGHGVTANGSMTLVGGTADGKGNIISGNSGDGVHVTAGAVLVQGNYIGLDLTGTADLGNGANGVYANSAGSMQIGGSDPGARNVISGNQLVGVFIEDGTDDVTVFGNFIGLNASGGAPIRNIKAGIRVGGSNHQIGASFDGGRNVISGNGGPGIAVLSTASHIKIQNNLIGTNASGTLAIGNRNGIEVSSEAAGLDILIGGDPAGEGNLISGNQELGLLLAWGAKVQGNKIGTMPDGVGGLGNGTDGILIKGSGNRIGGAGFYNTIAWNGGSGVAVISEGGGAVDNSILDNSIHDNGSLGISIDENAVIPNDSQDLDIGDNLRQNYPVLTAAVADAAAMESVISGALHSAPGTVFTIQIFTNAGCDPSGYGEGHRLIKTLTVTTNAGGMALIEALFPATYIDPANFITATATDPAGNTSEFSNCIPVADKATITPTVAAMTFKPFADPKQIFYGTRCSPDAVRISVEIANPPEPIDYVLLFVRLMDKTTGEQTGWGGAFTMLTADKRIFYFDLISYDVPDYTKFENAVLQYQFVVYNKARQKIGHSEVYGDIVFTRCSPNKPAGVN